jgi:hypothetical protein
LASGTYTSGITATGTAGQTCQLTGFNGGGTGAVATVALTGTNTIAAGTALTFSPAGSGFSSAPTSATAASLSATCTGTAVVATTLVSPPSFTVEVGQLSNSYGWINSPQALMPILNGAPLSVVVNLSSNAPGTLSTSQPTIQGGSSQVQVGFTPTADGSGSFISIVSATNVTDGAGSSQSTLEVSVTN